eukprot:g4799.t1 g4799   contig17:70700-71590(+)
MVALLFIRMVALVTCNLGNVYPTSFNNINNRSFNISFNSSSKPIGRAKKKIYEDYSTSTICKTVLCQIDQYQHRSSEVNGGNNNFIPYPTSLSPLIIHQLTTYVYFICQNYHSSEEVPYHNVDHGYHVFLSANKLLDLMLCEDVGGGSSSTTHRPTYGIKSSPLTQIAFLFSALVHDVDHTGISNRQLVLESDDLAILYNDQSVAEQRSLMAFSTLKGVGYRELRGVLFSGPRGGDGDRTMKWGTGATAAKSGRGRGSIQI